MDNMVEMKCLLHLAAAHKLLSESPYNTSEVLEAMSHIRCVIEELSGANNPDNYNKAS